MENFREMEQRLHDSETRLQLIFQSSLDGLFIFDPCGRCIDANPAGCEMTGYTLEQILSEYLRPYELIEETGKAEGIPVTGGDQPAVYRLDTPDGRVVWVRDEWIIRRDRTGQFGFIDGIISDVIEEKNPAR